MPKQIIYCSTHNSKNPYGQKRAVVYCAKCDKYYCKVCNNEQHKKEHKYFIHSINMNFGLFKNMPQEENDDANGLPRKSKHVLITTHIHTLTATALSNAYL